MPQPPYFIGLDVSTTASKALLVDASGTVISTRSHSHPISTPRPLWSEQDPRDWWTAASAALRDVMQSVAPEEVAAIGLTGQMHGLTALDAAGEPVRPAILWNDQRSGEQCARVSERIGAERLYRLIGTRLLPGFTAPKLVWVHDHEPEVFARITHFLLPKDYLRYRLSGAFITDVADGSGISLMDISKRAWSAEMLDACGIPSAWLPELVESQAVCATVSAAAAAETGLRAGTPIVGGAGDQPASGVGNGIVSFGQCSLTIGTSGVAYAINNRYAPEPDGRLHTFCGPMPGTWFHMGVMLSAAGSMRWLHDSFAPHSDYDDLSQQAATVPAGSEGLLFAPYLTGERNPHPDPFARGALVGLTVRHSLKHLVRAVMEGVSFGMRDLLELLRALGVQPDDAVLSGGAANSAVWRELTTAIMGIPLYTVNSNEGSAFGAAILAAVGAGVYPDVPTACAHMVRRVETFQPDPADSGLYQRLYPHFQALYPALSSTFASLAEFEG